MTTAMGNQDFIYTYYQFYSLKRIMLLAFSDSNLSNEYNKAKSYDNIIRGRRMEEKVYDVRG